MILKSMRCLLEVRVPSTSVNTDFARHMDVAMTGSAVAASLPAAPSMESFIASAQNGGTTVVGYHNATARRFVDAMLNCAVAVGHVAAEKAQSWTRGGVWWLAAMLLLTTFCGPQRVLGQTFTDWTSAAGTQAAGTLGNVSVTIASSDSDVFVSSVLDGSSTVFNDPLFTPALPMSDMLYIQGKQVPVTYTITFSQPVTNPVLHLASLASTLTFSGINPVKLSGQTTLTVSDNRVIGSILSPLPLPLNDANGTILLPGTFSVITFTAEYSSLETFDLALGGTPSTSIWASSYDPSLGTLPQAQGWAYEGDSPSPGPSGVSGGVLRYGPTTAAGSALWRTRPHGINFSNSTWSLTTRVRLTGTTFGNAGGVIRGGFALYVQDDFGRWINAYLGSNALVLANNNAGTTLSPATLDMATAFRTVRLDAGPSGGRLYVDDVLVQSLALATNGPNGAGAYWGDATGLASSELTELQFASFGFSAVPLQYAGPTENAIFSGTRPDPGAGSTTTFTLNSLTVPAGGNFTLGSGEALNLNNGQGTLYINQGATFIANGTILGNIFNAGLLIIPITQAGLVFNVQGPGIIIVTTPPVTSPVQPPTVLPPSPQPPRVDTGALVTIGGSGFEHTNGGMPGGGSPGSGYPGHYVMPGPSFQVGGSITWDGQLEVSGTYTQTATGVLRMFIAGTDRGRTYSHLNVGMSATIAGEVQVVLQPELFNYLPQVGNSFDFVYAAGGLTIAPGGLNVRTLMTAAGANYLGVSLPPFNSGFAADPNQLVSLPANAFTYSVVNGNTLRLTLTDPIVCGVLRAPANRVTCPTGGAYFNAVVPGSLPATFLWQYRGTGGRPPLDWTTLQSGQNDFGPGLVLDIVDPTAQLLTFTHSGQWPALGEAAGGEFRCLITSPCGTASTPLATLSICKTDMNCDATLSLTDIFDFLNAWFAGSPIADFDGGGLDVQDVFAFLNAWFSGC